MGKEQTTESITKKANYFFIALYVLAIITLFLLFSPYLSFLILGAIIVIFLFPINLFLRKFIKNKIACSILMTGLVLLFILIPTLYLGYVVTKEATSAYTMMLNTNYSALSTQISNVLGFPVDISDLVIPLSNFLVSYMSNALPSLLSSISDFTVKLFLMFFLIYYTFKEGDIILHGFMNILPITKNHKEQILDEANKVLYGVMHGQFLIALIQGILGGLGFWVFGFPNPVFWGFIMGVLAFIPMLGTPLVWLPASLIQLAAGNKFGAIGMLLFGAIIVMNIDNVLKPRIIGNKTGLHPLLVLLGIFGGIQLFGIIGMIIGPIIVALCILIIKFFNQDVVFA
ncbi:MAG: AI-2E family transporter [Candidatus Woesearchaeota archaeon]|jgi:predicted PurR-regulated permease PerM